MYTIIPYLVQICFDLACERLISDNQEKEADQLANATVHWLRYAGISDVVETRPREHVHYVAGHSSWYDYRSIY